jgi:hypothetical protein
MEIIGPDRYRLTWGVGRRKTTPAFDGRAAAKGPKLYVVSSQNIHVYVGTTKQPMMDRLSLGWYAKGRGGYYGYAWRHKLTEADIAIWYHLDSPADKPMLDVETIEAEVAFLIRQAGQWPKFQTEIHFHPSTKEHWAIAKRIVSGYTLP